MVTVPAHQKSTRCNQDYGIGKIVGTQTYGKGVVQQIFDLDDGTAVKLTIAEYFTPRKKH